MNAPLVVFSSVLLATGTAYAVTAWRTPQPPISEAALTASTQLEQRVREVETKLEQTLGRLEQLSARLQALPAGRTPAEPVSAAMIEAALAKWMAANGTVAASTPSSKSKIATIEEALARIDASAKDFDSLVAAWKEIEEAGHGDAVIAQFENGAKAAPGDADAQFHYGSILLVALQNKPTTMQGEYAMKADAAFDRALENDEQHWGARFSKATSLSFWPKITGKQTEAMKHFEVLMSQQEAGQTKPEFAQTYLFLGNMYQDNGQGDKAKEVFERGLRYFPNDAGLKAQRDLFNKR